MEQETAAALKCAECSGEVESGFLLDLAHTWVFPAVWADGLVLKNWFGGIKLEGRRLFRVETWRCKGCGHLESYAQRETGLYEKE